MFHCSPRLYCICCKVSVAWRSHTVCWMTWHLSPSLIMANDDSDYCYRSCRSDSMKVLWAAHTAGSSAAQPYFCHNMHLTEAQGRLREDRCTCEDGPVKYWRPASVALCDPGGRTRMLKKKKQKKKKPSNTCAVVLKWSTGADAFQQQSGELRPCFVRKGESPLRNNSNLAKMQNSFWFSLLFPLYHSFNSDLRLVISIQETNNKVEGKWRPEDIRLIHRQACVWVCVCVCICVISEWDVIRANTAAARCSLKTMIILYDYSRIKTMGVSCDSA